MIKTDQTYKSGILAALHETASELHELQLMDKQTMRRFDDICATSNVPLSAGFVDKVPAIQAVVMQLMSDLGPDRVLILENPNQDRESITIASRDNPTRAVFISTIGREEGRYLVTYDQLSTKRSGEVAVESQTVSDVLYEGLRWIVRKVFTDGAVIGEFDRLPKRGRIRQ